MGNAVHPLFSLARVLETRSDLDETFAFHHAAASNNHHLRQRTKPEFESFAARNALFSARSVSSGKLVGLCYAVPPSGQEWEVGGMVIAPEERRSHVASALGSFGLTHTIVFERPWSYGQEIVAYVKEGNKDGEALTQAVFVHVPHDQGDSHRQGGVPASRKFLFPRSALGTLAEMFNRCFTQPQAEFQIEPPKLLDILKEGLEEVLREVELLP